MQVKKFKFDATLSHIKTMVKETATSVAKHCAGLKKKKGEKHGYLEEITTGQRSAHTTTEEDTRAVEQGEQPTRGDMFSWHWLSAGFV